jgi:hypothetical protein
MPTICRTIDQWKSKAGFINSAQNTFTLSSPEPGKQRIVVLLFSGKNTVVHNILIIQFTCNLMK